ncbi:unnamed protein product [Ambrosiozyma monospora]|uniref:Unnamed protein product n=1 Tax=Ambrosiozyma monospora TaxID=43982 RepID=A0A9W6YSA4_AMBMO|nr:unnamed protein product [Ambrosiozyma monospora]
MKLNSRLFQLLATSFLLLTLNVEALKDWQTQFHLPNGDPYLIGCQISVFSTLVFDYEIQTSGATGEENENENDENEDDEDENENDSNENVYLGACTYPPAVGSWFLCIDELIDHNEKLLKRIANRASEKCFSYTNLNMGGQFYIDNFHNATKYEIDSSSIQNKKL